jgi:cell division protein FtsB
MFEIVNLNNFPCLMPGFLHQPAKGILLLKKVFFGVTIRQGVNYFQGSEKMSGSGKSSSCRRSGRNKRDMIVISAVVTALFIVLLAAGISARSKLNEAYDKNEEIRVQLEAEEERAANLEDYKAASSSDEAIKRAAGEKLGLVEENQIIFRLEE